MGMLTMSRCTKHGGRWARNTTTKLQSGANHGQILEVLGQTRCNNAIPMPADANKHGKIKYPQELIMMVVHFVCASLLVLSHSITVNAILTHTLSYPMETLISLLFLILTVRDHECRARVGAFMGFNNK